MEKRNVVEQRRTPKKERERQDGDWDKTAAAEFKAVPAPKPSTFKGKR